jgi:hypothetical protein
MLRVTRNKIISYLVSSNHVDFLQPLDVSAKLCFWVFDVSSIRYHLFFIAWNVSFISPAFQLRQQGSFGQCFSFPEH